MKVKRHWRNIGKAVEIVAPRTPRWHGQVGHIQRFRGNDFDPITREAIPFVVVFIKGSGQTFWAPSLRYVDLPKHKSTAFWNGSRR